MDNADARPELPEPPATPAPLVPPAAYLPPPPAPLTPGRTARRRPRRALLSLSVAIALLAAGAVGAGVADLASRPATTSVAPANLTAAATGGAAYTATTDPAVRAIAQVGPAVVNITSQIQQTSPFGGTSTGTGTGTGFIVRPEGVILTNDHVVEGASSLQVTLPDGGRSYPATVLRADSAHDLAVVKIDATGLPTVTLGDSSGVALGQKVIALGYALDLGGGPTVTSGIVSSLDRTIQVQDPNAATGGRTYRDVLQTDAAINPGNSGGPLINLSGQVVGIDSAGTQQAENIGFAIRIDAAKSILARALA
ncbi:MAG: S1C family serine protease [Actinomycetota bacterium]